MTAVRNKRTSSSSGSNDASKRLHMTYHNTAWYKTPNLTEVDLSLAEASVNRIRRFTTHVNTYMQNPADLNFTYINTRYLAAAGGGTTKEKNAGKTILVDLGIASDILAPQDKLPSVQARIDDLSRT